MTGSDSEKQGEKRASGHWRAMAAGILLSLLILTPALLYPFGRDQSVFAYVGSVIARGGMPYRDAWDVKPPVIYLLYAGLVRLAGGTGERLTLLVHLVDWLLAGVTGALLVRLARFFRNDDAPMVGIAAAGWFAALYLQGGFWGLAQTETWSTPLVLGATIQLLRISDGEGSSGGWLLAGLLAGVAAVLKFTTLLPLFPFVILAVRSGSRGKGQRWGLFCLVLGAAIPAAASFGWLWSAGAWSAFLDVQRGFVAPYSRLNGGGLGLRAWNLVRYTGPWLLHSWLAVLAAAPAPLCLDGWRNGRRNVAGAWLLAGLFAVWIQNKYFGYHWQTALPPLALLAAAGGSTLAVRLRSQSPATRWLPAALAVVWTLVCCGSYYRDALLYAVGRLPREAWLARFHAGKDFSYLADAQVARYVARETRPDDPVLIWGFEPPVYLLSGRLPPTRFFFNVPVGVTFAPPAWRDELLRDLGRRPPVLVLVLRNDAIPWASGRADDSEAQLRSWPELNGWLQAHYRSEAQIEDFTIYRRWDAGRGF